MPRTKRPGKKQEKSAEDSDDLKKLDILVAEQKDMIDSRLQLEIRNVELAYKILLGSLNKSYLQMTIGQLRSELHLQDVPNTQRTRHSSRSALNDDGYNTESSSHGSGERAAKTHLAVPMSSGRAMATCRRSRSASASTTSRNQSQSTAKQTQRRRSRSVYRTPACNKNALYNYPLITPKVTPNAALTVLRQPRQGEMVLSMAGSPVMVPTCYTMKPDEKANCNILLEDGTTLSLQPNTLRQSQTYIPFSLMDSKVFDQLKTLKDNLHKVLELGEKVMK